MSISSITWIRRRGFTAFIIASVVLLIYLAIPTNEFNGDGLGYSAITENAYDSKLFSISARLLFCPTGRLVQNIFDFFGYQVRSVYALQMLNSLFGALAVGVMCLAAFSISENREFSLLAALGFGFSLSVWFWCTNCTSYPGNIFFLVVTLYLLIKLTQGGGSGRYLVLSLLIGLTHALANLYWLSALLLAPSIAIGILIASRDIPFSKRIYACITYSISLILFLFAPQMIAGFATGRISSMSEFFPWLSAASYGIPPELSLLNISRGVIGFSSSIFHIVELGPAIKQAFWGVPHAGSGGIKPYVEIIMFVILWGSLAFAGIYAFRNRVQLFGVRTRLALIFALWAIPPIVLGLTWLGSDTERWLAILPLLWLLSLLIMMHARSTGNKPLVIGVWLFVAVMFLHNLVFAVIPANDPENNRYLNTARSLDKQMSERDIVFLWGHDNVFTADHLRYFFDIESYHLAQIAREQPEETFQILESAIDDCLGRGGRAFVNGRIFLDEDLPESHRSDESANIKRAEFARFFANYDAKEAFTLGHDIYWEVRSVELDSGGLNHSGD